MRKYCGNCEQFHEVTAHKEIREYVIKDTKIKAEITILTCNYCNEEIYDKETEMANDVIFFDAYKKKKHLLTSHEIIKIREKYGVSQATFSKILGFGAKTITRYENGSIQDTTHDKLIRLMQFEANFFALTLLTKDILTQAEQEKITKKLHTEKVEKYDYKYDEQTTSTYQTIVHRQGGLVHDWR